ncbi:helix-turn-helix domain-containing protein [Undibacterium sp. Tian12W]|uniref:helix-turn-helix domain-containing protein n=1 Tax=Undibacterium sp. Tian12W TaxID=3413054 RepID=UPI003BF16BD1
MLTAIRLEKGMLQSDIAAKLSKNQSFVSKYERGERRLDFPEFLDVALALEINPTDFIKKYQTALERSKI